MDLASPEFFPLSQQPGLFRSSAWLSAWYDTWGKHPAILLPETLIGPASSANLHQIVVRVKTRQSKFLPIINAFPPGLSSTSIPSIRSEYFFFEKEEDNLSGTVQQWLDDAMTSAWDQLYIADVLRSSRTYKVLLEEAADRKLEVIHKSVENTYAVDLRHQDFPGYLKSLGKNTRLKLFNRRNNLAELGTVNIANLWPDRDAFFDLLDEFHQARWGKRCYRERNREFINLLLDNLHNEGHQIDFSVLSVNDKPVSAVFDICYQGRKYNLQTGYQQNFHKSISLGTLHFGYQIEGAFNNPDLQFYDFMAGKGKNADYKKSLANRSDEFATLLLIRNPLLKFFYRTRSLLLNV